MGTLGLIMVNPYQAPDSAAHPERSIHIVKMRTPAEISLIWGMLLVVLGGVMYLENPTRDPAAGGGHFWRGRGGSLVLLA
jgi:hypothetical protein